MTKQAEGKQFRKQIDSYCAAATVSASVAIEIEHWNKNKRGARWAVSIDFIIIF